MTVLTSVIHLALDEIVADLVADGVAELCPKFAARVWASGPVAKQHRHVAVSVQRKVIACLQ